MSKRKNKLPSYRRHKSSGQAVVTLSDKDIYLGVHGTEDSQAAYRRVIAEWLENKQQPPASSRTGAKPDIESANVHRLFVAYWQFCQAYYVSDGQPTHEIDNMLHAARPLIELFGDGSPHTRPRKPPTSATVVSTDSSVGESGSSSIGM
jgi:hypothetical protein